MHGTNKILSRIILPAVMPIIIMLSSCARMTPEERKPEDLDLPERYSLYEKSAAAPERWWETFGSEELNHLVDAALSENLTLQQSYARLRQARASALMIFADSEIDLTLESSISHTRQRADNGKTDPVYSTIKNKRIGLAGSYEIDLWGKINAQNHRAFLNMAASRQDMFTAMQSLSAELTLNWLKIISYKKQIELLNTQLKTNQSQLELIELRFRKGQATALDIYQQRQAVNNTISLIPPRESTLQTLQHNLSILLGQPPSSDPGPREEFFPDPGKIPDQGVPAKLLENRPDIRASGLRLRASDWQIVEARANRLPSLRISATGAFSSGDWSLLFENWAAGLAGNLTAPLLDGGRREAELQRTEAVVDENFAAYKESVLKAIMQVEDALIREKKQGEFISNLEMNLDTARAYHREAIERYRKGQGTYLPVLNALNTVQALERSLVDARYEKLAYRVELHRALGGHWMKNDLSKIKESKND